MNVRRTRRRQQLEEERVRRVLASLMGVMVLLVGLVSATPSASAIVGGQEAVSNPGAVSMWTLSPKPERNRCGGTLVASRWVVTAAHCAELFTDTKPVPGVFTPASGSMRIGSVSNVAGYFEGGLDGVIVYDGYVESPLYENDIAMFKLHNTVPASAATPVDFVGDSVPVGSRARAYGWGWKCETLGDPECRTSVKGNLRQLDVTILSDSSCATVWFPDRQVCMKASDGTHSMTCFGDSGDGLFVKGLNSGQWRLREIVAYDGDDWSGGAVCADSAIDGGPGLGVALDVAPFASWMYHVMVTY